MAEQPNPDDFTKDEKPGEYGIRFRVKGEIRLTIKAESKEDAKAQAEAMLEDEDFGLELDEVDEVRVDYVYKTPAMFRVMREGKVMQVSRLEPGDVARAPNEYGF